MSVELIARDMHVFVQIHTHHFCNFDHFIFVHGENSHDTNGMIAYMVTADSELSPPDMKLFIKKYDRIRNGGISIVIGNIVLITITRGGPYQHRFMCGRKQWSNDINESNYNMQPIIIQPAVRTIRISRANIIIQIDPPDGSTKLVITTNVKCALLVAVVVVVVAAVVVVVVVVAIVVVVVVAIVVVLLV